MNTTLTKEPPRWQLSMYKGFEARNYKNDIKEFSISLKKLKALLMQPCPETETKKGSINFQEVLTLLNRAFDLHENLESYTYCSYSIDTANGEALGALNRLEEAALPLAEIQVLLRQRLMEDKSWKDNEDLKDFTYFMHRSVEEGAFQLSAAEEDLAADLNRSGASAWERLHQGVSSSLKCKWEGNEEKSVVELRAMASHEDRDVRRRAWEKELSCWKSAQIPLAAALNGVKGSTEVLNRRRGCKSTLDRAVRQSEMSRETLNAMIEAMKGALPDFRRYMKAKARLLGLEKLSWYDVIAPVKGSGKSWSWEECRQFIIKHFGALSPEYSDFAKNCFANFWIDAPPRPGKVGGAYCISFPLQEESRILCNFTGSFTDVSTVAHELGHAWHHEVLKKAPSLHRRYPMTLAETASIFSETLVFQACYAQAEEKEKLSLLEGNIADSNQVITDILSRFLFEKALMEGRKRGEIPPEELNNMMLQAQEETYGEGLDPIERHPWMWAVKGHYYSQDLAFYNFPYAFGLLFALGLYSLYQTMGKDFEPLYRRVLLKTGRASAEDCAREAGLDIRDGAFWNRSLDTIRKQIDLFCQKAETAIQ